MTYYLEKKNTFLFLSRRWSSWQSSSSVPKLSWRRLVLIPCRCLDLSPWPQVGRRSLWRCSGSRLSFFLFGWHHWFSQPIGCLWAWSFGWSRWSSSRLTDDQSMSQSWDWWAWWGRWPWCHHWRWCYFRWCRSSCWSAQPYPL